MTTNTEPIKPRSEKVVGRNIPYRGLEQHGVIAENNEYVDPGLGYEDITNIITPPRALNAIKVMEIRPHITSRTAKYTLGPNKQLTQILPPEEKRTRAVITVLDGDVHITTHRGAYEGFRIPTLTQLEVFTQDQIEAYTSWDAPATLCVYSEIEQAD